MALQHEQAAKIIPSSGPSIPKSSSGTELIDIHHTEPVSHTDDNVLQELFQSTEQQIQDLVRLAGKFAEGLNSVLDIHKRIGIIFKKRNENKDAQPTTECAEMGVSSNSASITLSSPETESQPPISPHALPLIKGTGAATQLFGHVPDPLMQVTGPVIKQCSNHPSTPEPRVDSITAPLIVPPTKSNTDRKRLAFPPWTPAEDKVMVDTVQKLQPLLSTGMRKGEVFETVSKRLKSEGWERTAATCQTRYWKLRKDKKVDDALQASSTSTPVREPGENHTPTIGVSSSPLPTTSLRTTLNTPILRELHNHEQSNLSRSYDAGNDTIGPSTSANCYATGQSSFSGSRPALEPPSCQSNPAPGTDSEVRPRKRLYSEIEAETPTAHLRFLNHQQSADTAIRTIDDRPISQPPIAKSRGLHKGTSRSSLVAEGHLARSNRTAIKESVNNHLHHNAYWTGAAHDFLNVAWSPDGMYYAAGSATDPQYNRPYNLLFGCLASNLLTDLPDHRITQQGNGSRFETHVYETVSSVQFSASGESLVTSSYDNTVRVWNWTGKEIPDCSSVLVHEARVEVLALASGDTDLMATGSPNYEDSLTMFFPDSDGQFQRIPVPLRTGFSHEPTCLQFGKSPSRQNWLLAGFGATSRNNFAPANRGFLRVCRVDEGKVWQLPDFSSNYEFVFDVAWSATSNAFAMGSVQEKKKPRHRTHVRLYDSSQSRGYLRLPCPALDINQVSICPYGEHYVTASCTDNTTYVWDQRKPNNLLHTLSHGSPIVQYRDLLEQESRDVGIRMIEWIGLNQLYTGGSDGSIRIWDIRRSPADACREVTMLSSEIMCGSLSPDRSCLLVGDSNCTLHLFDKSPHPDTSDDSPVQLSIRKRNPAAEESWGTEGRDAARALVTSGELLVNPYVGQLDPYKVVQGPNYRGPYASNRQHSDNEVNVDILLSNNQTSYPMEDPLWRMRVSASVDLRAMSALTTASVRSRGAVHPSYNLGSEDNNEALGQESYINSDDEDGDEMRESWLPPHWQVDANLEKREGH